jgi:hypothetical protein
MMLRGDVAGDLSGSPKRVRVHPRGFGFTQEGSGSPRRVQRRAFSQECSARNVQSGVFSEERSARRAHPGEFTQQASCKGLIQEAHPRGSSKRLIQEAHPRGSSKRLIQEG